MKKFSDYTFCSYTLIIALGSVKFYIRCLTTCGLTAGGDFLCLCDQKSSYKRVPDFGRLRSYGYILIPVNALV